MPGRGVMPPFYKVVQAVFVMTVEQFFEFPFFDWFDFSVLSLKDASAYVP